eukprot:gb/GEZJ01005494.1/.p3 GENE.gb/GEZJ01005494.1/~~gb/GEZJ01005494.1/.p3  ORF type:complete len:107 (-),score=3.06 gb/GEZJ01005494.1/:1158-1478(-)
MGSQINEKLRRELCNGSCVDVRGRFEPLGLLFPPGFPSGNMKSLGLMSLTDIITRLSLSFEGEHHSLPSAWRGHSYLCTFLTVDSVTEKKDSDCSHDKSENAQTSL